MASAGLKRILHWMFGDYHFWKVFVLDLPVSPQSLPPGITIRPIDPDDFDTKGDVGVAERMASAGENSQGLALYVNDDLAAVQWCWWGPRYEAERGGRSWRIPPDAAKSVAWYTLPHHRGRGYMALLSREMAALMWQRGFTRLYTRIWHSHHSSIRASRKAGWKPVGSYIELEIGGKRLQFQLSWLR